MISKPFIILTNMGQILLLQSELAWNVGIWLFNTGSLPTYTNDFHGPSQLSKIESLYWYMIYCSIFSREIITMLTSAFWHGVYSGYYLSMLTVPFILAVEDFFDRLLRKKLSESVSFNSSTWKIFSRSYFRDNELTIGFLGLTKWCNLVTWEWLSFYFEWMRHFCIGGRSVSFSTESSGYCLV